MQIALSLGDSIRPFSKYPWIPCLGYKEERQALDGFNSSVSRLPVCFSSQAFQFVEAPLLPEFFYLGCGRAFGADDDLTCLRLGSSGE